MAEQKFSKKEAFSFGWGTLKSNLWFFVGILIVIGIINAIVDKLSDVTQENLIILSLFIWV